jgi:hypothetical protein
MGHDGVSTLEGDLKLANLWDLKIKKICLCKPTKLGVSDPITGLLVMYSWPNFKSIHHDW